MIDMNIEDRHLIDRYLRNDISGIELENFLQRMKADDVLAKQVDMQRLIYAGIQKANLQNLRDVIISSLDYRKPAVPLALKMIVTFIFITVIGISLWSYLGNETANKDMSNSWFAFLKSKNKDQPIKVNDEKISHGPRQKNSIPADTATASNLEEPGKDSLEGELQSSALPVDSPVITTEEENIVVKQDQLLISTAIIVEDKSEDGKPTDESLSKGAVEHLNPAADLPETESPPSSFITEFWVSPINYRGYKMSKNKLVLFGIEEPDAVKLYRVNDAIYMSYLREYYRLNDTFDFMSYQKLKEAEIPLAIK
jgi:hypothetical protein